MPLGLVWDTVGRKCSRPDWPSFSASGLSQSPVAALPAPCLLAGDPEGTMDISQRAGGRQMLNLGSPLLVLRLV